MGLGKFTVIGCAEEYDTNPQEVEKPEDISKTQNTG
jgi:hypothetical protein